MKETPKSILKILEAIKGMQQFCVVGHIRPDGDCIGSQLALTLALQSQGLDVCCWNQDPAPAKLQFMDAEGLLKALNHPTEHLIVSSPLMRPLMSAWERWPIIFNPANFSSTSTIIQVIRDMGTSTGLLRIRLPVVK